MMIVLRTHPSYPWCPLRWLTLLVITISLLVSCGDDDSVDEEVQTLLDQAQSAMEGINVPISFNSVETLATVSQFADPLELGALEDVVAIESSIDALNQALDAKAFPPPPAAPAVALQDEDRELETIIHLNLAYLYMLAAVSRCVIDGGDIYTIEAGDNPDTSEIEFYTLALKPIGSEKLEVVKAKPEPTATDFLSIFGPQQRQAIINALNLMDQVEASVEAIPESGIDRQEPDYDRSICQYSSAYHHRHASAVAPLVGERAGEVADLVSMVGSQFFLSLQEKSENWRFAIIDRPAKEKQ